MREFLQSHDTADDSCGLIRMLASRCASCQLEPDGEQASAAVLGACAARRSSRRQWTLRLPPQCLRRLPKDPAALDTIP
jgi:hypothetical protein